MNIDYFDNKDLNKYFGEICEILQRCKTEDYGIYGGGDNCIVFGIDDNSYTELYDKEGNPINIKLTYIRESHLRLEGSSKFDFHTIIFRYIDMNEYCEYSIDTDLRRSTIYNKEQVFKNILEVIKKFDVSKENYFEHPRKKAIKENITKEFLINWLKENDFLEEFSEAYNLAKDLYDTKIFIDTIKYNNTNKFNHDFIYKELKFERIFPYVISKFYHFNKDTNIDIYFNEDICKYYKGDDFYICDAKDKEMYKNVIKTLGKSRILEIKNLIKKSIDWYIKNYDKIHNLLNDWEITLVKIKNNAIYGNLLMKNS